MSGHFPNVETIRAALLLASRAPSPDNSQPWRWHVHESALDLFADTGGRAGGADPGVMLSCGAALNHCVVALAALGWQSRVHHLPEGSGGNHLARVEVYPREPEQVDITLAAAIPRRRTDRRHYGFWPVPAADVALMGARAARVGVMLRQVDRLDKLNAVVAQAVFRHAPDFDYPHELTALTQPLDALAVSGADDRAVLLALGTDADDRLSRLRAGEAASVVLLTATALGLASCPVTEPLESGETRATVRRDVFGVSGFPQILVRVGWAPINADPLPPTPRLDLARTVDWTIPGDRGDARSVPATAAPAGRTSATACRHRERTQC